MATTVTFNIRLKDGGTTRQVSVDVDELNDALRNVEHQAERTSQSVAKSTGAFEKLRSSMGRLVSVTAAISVLKSALTTIMNFERANSELASVLDTTAEGVAGLTRAAQDLGRVTEFTATEVTSLQTSLARLGFNNNQILDMQEGVLKFASAVGTDLSSAADFTGSALRAFGLQSKDTKALLDVMAASTAKSALSFSKLETSISIVAPVAKSFGLSAADTTALLGGLANAGFDASSAATALRAIILNLANENGKLAQGLGHTAKTLPEIISSLQELQSKGVDLNATLEMTDKRSVAAFNAFIDGADSVKNLRASLSDCDGQLERMYGTMTNNLQGAVNGLKSAWEGFVLTLQDSKGPLTEVTNGLSDLLNKATDAMRALSADKADDATRQGQGLMARYWRMATSDEAIAAIESDINGQIENQQQKVIQMENNLANIVGNVQKRNYKKQLEQERFNLRMLEAARADYYDRLKWKAGTYWDNDSNDGGNGNNNSNDGGEPLGKGLAADIEKYRTAVQRVVETNKALNYGVKETEVRLQAMSSGITSLINKYGSENDAIKQLIKEYRDLWTERHGVNDDLPKLAGITGEAKGPGLVVKPGKKPFEPLTNGADEAVDAINSIAGAMNALSGVVDSSASSWMSWIASIMQAVGRALPAITALTAAHKAKMNAAAGDAVAEGMSSVASVPFAGPAMAIAAAAGIIAALASIPKFANGGMVYGPTLGLFGEYSGAAANPEVIAPLDKLRGMLGGDLAGKVEFEIDGRKLRGFLNKMDRFDSRVG